jgi:signal transduction histidine kinase
MRRFDLLVGVSIGVMTLYSLAVAVVPGMQIAVYAPRLDLAINVVATVVAAVVAALAWSRYREAGRIGSLYQSAAFVALAVTNLVVVVLVVLGVEAQFGFTLESPREAPAWVWTFARLVAAALLLVGARAAWRRESASYAHPRVLVLVPALLFTVAILVIPVLGRYSDATGAQVDPGFGSGALPVQMPSLSLGLVAAQVVVAVLFLAAAALYLRLYWRDRSTVDGYLAIGLVVAAFSQMHTAVLPVVYTGIVTTGDTLRVLFYLILLLAIEAGMRADLATLRTVNVDLARLRDADVARAGMEERARLAREVHDGLAQDLWFAKLKQARQSQVPGVPPEAQELGREVGQAIDAALAEARQAVMAMRADRDDEEPLADVLIRYVDDFSDRFGLSAEFVATGPMPPLPARTKAELLRIAQEALNNVRKHADAAVVRVEAGAEDGEFVLRIVDNGTGFDPDRVPAGRVGLHSMRERAELVGATIEIISAPSDGTRVEVTVPVEASQ